MKKLLFTLTAALAIFSANGQSTTWKLDMKHSNTKFTVTHMIVSELDGSFNTFDGTLVSTKPDFSDSKINFSVDVATVNTDDADRDAHLKGDDFFNAEKYPKMTFTSTSFKKVSDKKYILEGDLTIRDVTKRVKFDVTGGNTAIDPWGNTKAGFKAVTTVNRIAYGLKWNKAVEAGGWVVGEDVTIVMNVELNKVKN